MELSIDLSIELSIGIKITYKDPNYNQNLQGIVAAINLPAPYENQVRIITNGMIHYAPIQSILKIHGWN